MTMEPTTTGSVAGHYVDLDGEGDVIGPGAGRGAVPFEGPAFDAIRERVPKGSSAVVVIAAAERVRAMSEALASSAETFDGYRLGPAGDAELRSVLAAAPPSTTSRQRG